LVFKKGTKLPFTLLKSKHNKTALESKYKMMKKFKFFKAIQPKMKHLMEA